MLCTGSALADAFATGTLYDRDALVNAFTIETLCCCLNKRAHIYTYTYTHCDLEVFHDKNTLRCVSEFKVIVRRWISNDNSIN